MDNSAKFPLIVTPQFLRFCRNLALRRRLKAIPFRVIVDDSDGVAISVRSTYDDEQDDLLEEEGVCVIVERELGERLRGWKLDAIASLHVDESFTPTPPGQDSTASNPGRLSLDRDLVRAVQPELAGWQGWLWRIRDRQARTSRFEGSFEWIADQIQNGDTRAAVVLELQPLLLIAAYSDDMDCVAVLSFSKRIARHFNLEIGSRLVTCNRYQVMNDLGVVDDLTPGPRSHNGFSNFRPIIANFVSADQQRLDQLTASISPDEWNRASELGAAWLNRFAQKQVKPRVGAPIWAHATANNPPLIDAGLRERVVACVLDLVMVTVIVAGVWWIYFGFDDVFMAYLNQPRVPATREKFLAMRNEIREYAALGYLGYCVVLLSCPWQTTLGKWLFGLKVISTKTSPRVSIIQALMRTVFMLVGTVFVLREIVKSETSQAWHDEKSKTRVVRAI